MENNKNKRWEELLNPDTFRERSDIKKFDGRNPFENDYGRLISSSPIRRLQDKTQVFPLEQSDFIRTRLTHSLEVSYIGSSIGQSVEQFLFEKKYLDEKKFTGHLSSLLRVAGLVHDLGNPPFGHFGESAIQDFFKKYFENNKYGLNETQIADFTHFDGNVQTFRILRKLHYFGDEYSFNLTYPSLASIIKYPYNSLEGNKGKKDEKDDIAKKKFGYFDSEKEDYTKINSRLNLNNRRHPLVYLLEAADDIAYSAADLEDGVKLGLVSYNSIKTIFGENLNKNKDLIQLLDKIYLEAGKNVNDQLSLTAQRFRIATQSKMIEAVLKCFEENYDSIMDGTFHNEIIDVSDAADIRKSYKKLQYLVFDDKKIMQTELAGWEIISGLLEIYLQAAESPNFTNSGNNKEARLYKNISSSYRYIYENIAKENYNNEIYNKIQLIVDFISGMTDSYALNLYQKLKGITT